MSWPLIGWANDARVLVLSCGNKISGARTVKSRKFCWLPMLLYLIENFYLHIYVFLVILK